MKRLLVIVEKKKLLTVGVLTFLLLGIQPALAANQTGQAAIRVTAAKSEGFMDVAAQILGIKAVKVNHNQYKIYVAKEKKQLYLNLVAELSYLKLTGDKNRKPLAESAGKSVVDKQILVTTSGSKGSRLLKLINLIYETKTVRAIRAENKYLLKAESEQKAEDYSALLMLSPYLVKAESRLQTAASK